VPEVAVVDMFYRDPPPVPEALVATLSLCNPETLSPFMWWLFTNADRLRERMAGVAPLSLGHRLIDRAVAEGPDITRAYQTLFDAAARR